MDEHSFWFLVFVYVKISMNMGLIHGNFHGEFMVICWKMWCSKMLTDQCQHEPHLNQMSINVDVIC